MTKSRRSQGLEPMTKEVERRKLPFELSGGGDVLVVQEIIPSRPRKLDDLEKVRSEMNAYLSYCKANDVVPSNAGFAVRMGVAKSTFETGFPDFGDEHRRLYDMFRAVIEDWVVQKLFEPKLSIASIFYLKNLGWRDEGRQMREGDDNRTVTQIFVNGGNEVRQIDVGKATNEVMKVKRKVGRPKKHGGEVVIVPLGDTITE